MTFEKDISPKARQQIYAIGDIHGRLDLLDRAIESIHRDIVKRGPPELIVTLGDYVDRGPQSRDVLERLVGNPFPTPFLSLKGNHEEMMMDFLDDAAGGSFWAQNGGLETLRSYGIPTKGLLHGASFAEAAKQLRAEMPASHLEFLKSLRPSYAHGNYFFCHAGVRPSVSLDCQSEDDLLWIREPFLASKANFGRIVVHGHTPTAEPEVRANRINIDTGAFMSGRLTCVALEDDGPRFLLV